MEARLQLAPEVEVIRAAACKSKPPHTLALALQLVDAYVVVFCSIDGSLPD
jgi:hypothetical protein